MQFDRLCPFPAKIAVLALGLSGAVWAGWQPAAAGGPEVDVYVFDDAPVPQPVMYRATVEATELLAAIGVRVVWRNGRPPRDHGCRTAIAITIENTAPQNIRHDVQAYTDLGDGSIRVFYERLHPWPSLTPTLMAQVFAHEIGHSLERIKRHSEGGIMKAHWDNADYQAMQRRSLHFSPLDAGLIRSAVVNSCPSVP